MKNKKSLALKMMTPEEKIQKGLPWYQTKFWQTRRAEIRIKVAKREQSDLAQKLGL